MPPAGRGGLGSLGGGGDLVGDLMPVPRFVWEVSDDIKNPTTSDFASKIPKIKETVSKLEEVGDIMQLQNFSQLISSKQLG